VHCETFYGKLFIVSRKESLFFTQSQGDDENKFKLVQFDLCAFCGTYVAFSLLRHISNGIADTLLSIFHL
jgi:hypothetical protein